MTARTWPAIPRRDLTRNIFLATAAVVAANTLISCGSSREDGDDNNQQIQLSFQQASQQLAAVIEERENALTDLAELQRDRPLIDLTRALQADRRTQPSTQAPERWRSTSIDAAPVAVERDDARLRELLTQREETLLRGAVTSHRWQAEVATQAEFLKELVKRTGLQGDYPPTNVFRILGAEQRARLRQRWLAKQHVTKALAAEHPDQFVEPLLNQCDERLRLLDEADRLGNEMLPRLPKARDALEVKQWIERARLEHDTRVAARERDLLRASLARNPNDIASAMRLAEIDKLAAVEPGRVIETMTRAHARARISAICPPPIDGSARERTLAAILINDPLVAAREESRLRTIWNSAGRSSPDAAGAGREAAFERWVAGRLRDAELVESERVLAEFTVRARALRVAGALPDGAEALDARLGRLQEAIAFERTRRRAGGAVLELSSDASAPRAAFALRILMGEHDLEARAIEWDTLRELSAGGYRSAELDRHLGELAVEGWRARIGQFAQRAESLKAIRLKASQVIDDVAPPEFGRYLAGATVELTRSADRIRAGLDGLPASAAESAAELKRAVDKALLAAAPQSWPAGDPKAPRPPPSGTPRPFGDPELIRADLRIREAIQQVAALKPSIPMADNRPYVAIESASGAPPIRGSRGNRPALKTWAVDGKVVSYQDIASLKSIKALPGGVALGQKAAVTGDWRAYTLVYSSAERRLKLVGPDGALNFSRVAPERLKAAAVFAKSGGAVAVSIGLSPQQADRDRPSTVFLDPALRDTQVGRDLIEADRLPWSLEDRTLPSGAPTPAAVYERMAAPLKAVRDTVMASFPVNAVLSDLAKDRELLKNGTASQLLEQISFLQPKATVLDLIIHAVLDAEETAASRRHKFDLLATTVFGIDASDANPTTEDKQRRTAVMQLINALPRPRTQAVASLMSLAVDRQGGLIKWNTLEPLALSFAAVDIRRPRDLTLLARQIIYEAVDFRQLSLMTDESVEVRRNGSDLDVSARLQIRYVHGSIIANDEGLSTSDRANDSPQAGQEATRAIPELEPVYLPLRAAREHAGWIAVMRWAFAPGNVAAVDLADLASVNHRNATTADYYCRGTVERQRRCAAAFGLGF